MTLAGEFRIPVTDFPLRTAVTADPGTRIDFVRVIVVRNVLSPFFWVTTDDLSGFHDAVDSDPSIAKRVRLDTFQDSALYRVKWDDETRAITSVLTGFRGSVLHTTGTHGGWDLRVRFPDRDALEAFRERLSDAGVAFTTRQLTSTEQHRPGTFYGLTGKQSEAILRAWEMGYYETPHDTTLEEIAADLGISQQALSDRLRRGHSNLIANTVVTGRLRGPVHE